MVQDKKVRVGVITLAVGLIIIGSLWTLHNIKPMPWIVTAIKYWPVILIFFGLELIVTKTLYEGKEGVSVTLDVGIIILLIVIILIGGGFSLINKVLPLWGIYL